MEVEVHQYSQSKPARHERVRNAYTKDGLYCIMLDDGNVYKYPVSNIFRIRETESESPVKRRRR